MLVCGRSHQFHSRMDIGRPYSTLQYGGDIEFHGIGRDGADSFPFFMERGEERRQCSDVYGRNALLGMCGVGFISHRRKSGDHSIDARFAIAVAVNPCHTCNDLIRFIGSDLRDIHNRSLFPLRKRSTKKGMHDDVVSRGGFPRGRNCHGFVMGQGGLGSLLELGPQRDLCISVSDSL